MSHAWSCLASEAVAYFHLCGKNAYGHADSSHITCPFFWDIALRCGPASILWNVWREVTQCREYLPSISVNHLFADIVCLPLRRALWLAQTGESTQAFKGIAMMRTKAVASRVIGGIDAILSCQSLLLQQLNRRGVMSSSPSVCVSCPL